MTTATIASIAAAMLSALNLFILGVLERRIERLENFVMGVHRERT